MFEELLGLPPGTAAQWAELVGECRPVLASEGMAAVQAVLLERGTGIVQAVVITKALLGWEDTPLAVAREIVETSAARTAG